MIDMALVTKHIMNAHKGNAELAIHFIAEKGISTVEQNKTVQL